MAVTIQTGAHQYTNTNITKYSLMMGGLNTMHDVLQQYDPLTGGNYRLFMVRKPLWVDTYFGKDTINKFTAFKHILEYGNLGVSGIQNAQVDFGDITGGYVGKKFNIAKTARDDTDELSIKVFELSGSPIREVLHTWINGTVDLDTGFAHYNGMIASGEIGFSQANHTCEFIYVVTDRTGMKVEYACHLTNCFPKEIPNDQFNGEAGQHEIVQYEVKFDCTKHEGIDVNEKAKILLKNHQIMTNSIEYYTGLNASDMAGNPTGYNPNTGMLETLTIGNKTETSLANSNNSKQVDTYRTFISNSDEQKEAQTLYNTYTDTGNNNSIYVTPSYTDYGNNVQA